MHLRRRMRPSNGTFTRRASVATTGITSLRTVTASTSGRPDRIRLLRQIADELTAPLAVMRECVELVADGSAGTLSSKQRTASKLLRRNGYQLQVLIDNFFAYETWQHKGRHLDVT